MTTLELIILTFHLQNMQVLRLIAQNRIATAGVFGSQMFLSGGVKLKSTGCFNHVIEGLT